MEFELRAVGGIESCFVSLPLPLIQTLQSGYLPPILAIELRSGARVWHVAWCGSASSSASSIEIAGKYADCIGLSDGTVVRVRVVGNLPKATLVTIEPLTEDDWEILELNAELAESTILKQVGIVHEQMRFPLWLHGQTVVMFLVVSVFPQKPVVQLVPGTEVAVAPKRRKHTSLNPEEVETIAKAQLRVQDSDCRFTHKFEENGIDMDILFTAGALIHPETAKKYSFSSLQFVVISPKDIKNSLHSKISTLGNEGRSGYPSGEQAGGKLVVCLLFSESVAKGHIQLSQSLRLYVGAGIHSWVHVKGYSISKKKDVSHASVSPYHFKLFEKDVFQNNSLGNRKNHENHKRRDALQENSSNSEMGNCDWSLHEKLLAALSSGSSHGEARETTMPIGETNAKVRFRDSLSSLLRAWFVAQLKIFGSNSAEGVMSLGSKTIMHLKVKNPRFHRYVKKTSNEIYPSNRKQSEASSVDFLYILSLSEESLHDEDSSAYEIAFDKCVGDNYASRSLDSLLGKLQLGDMLFSHAPYGAPTDDAFSSANSSLDWMGNAPVDVNYRLAVLLSPTSGMLLSAYNLPLPGHILIYGPPGCGKTLLAKVSAKSVEECRDILAHVVFVSCSRLTLEKPQTIRQALSGYISEALDCAPSVIILDDLDTLIAPASDLEGSQPSLSSAALVEFLADIIDEYAENSRSLCGMGPIAFIATAQSLTSLPQSLISSGRFDFHVNLPIPAVAERSALLKHEIQKRSLQCSDDLLSDIASNCDGYDAYDLTNTLEQRQEILVDRSVHAAIGRSLSTDFGSRENEKPTLVRDDFLQAMQNFLPVAMRDITKPASDAGRSGWEDVGGLNDIQNAIKEMIELPSKFRNIFAHAPLRMRSNVLLYGPPGCGKTHIVGAAAAACSLRFISVKGPELLNKYIGASEQAVRDIFSKAAAAAPCLLFFDEFDSIAPKRGHDNTGVTDRVVNQFLTELDGVEVLTGVFVFAATSRPDLLDAALLRPGRLDRLLLCDFPSPSERLEILKVLSRKLPMANDVDLEGIAHMTEGFSGADLQALLSDTQLEAVHELLDSENGSATGKMPVITNALLKSLASKAKPSVSQAEKRRLYDIYSQFLNSKRSLTSQSRDAKGKRATLA